MICLLFWAHHVCLSAEITSFRALSKQSWPKSFKIWVGEVWVGAGSGRNGNLKKWEELRQIERGEKDCSERINKKLRGRFKNQKDGRRNRQKTRLSPLGTALRHRPGSEHSGPSYCSGTHRWTIGICVQGVHVPVRGTDVPRRIRCSGKCEGTVYRPCTCGGWGTREAQLIFKWRLFSNEVLNI